MNKSQKVMGILQEQDKSELVEILGKLLKRADTREFFEALQFVMDTDDNFQEPIGDAIQTQLSK